MDGVVIKVDDVEMQSVLGSHRKVTTFGIAYKFPSEQASTVVEDIQLQVGRTGVVTPVAHLRPVLIAGSTVSRATLHNEDQIKALDVRIGDTVIIQKAGDIIPEIVSVITELRPKSTKAYSFPTHVSECGGDGTIERVRGEAAYRCVDTNSDALHRHRLYHFVSKQACNIDGLGPKIIDLLLDHNLINTAADLFTLTKGDVIDLPSFKEKAADNLIDAIDTARVIPLERFLVALSIDHVGEEMARLIAKERGSLDSVMRATKEELAAIHGVGDIVAEAVYEWFAQKSHRELTTALQEHMTITDYVQTALSGGPFEDKSVVFTGSLERMSRDDAEAKVRARGGRASSSVSKNTNYVVAGEKAGSKVEKARSLGVTVLTESEFLKML